jgi:hypothetical protein
MPTKLPYRRHLSSSSDLETTYEDTRAGFVALALEKNHRATPFVGEARALRDAASEAITPADLLHIRGIEEPLLTAAGVSDKAASYLQPEDKTAAIKNLIENYLEKAGKKFIEELVFRFLLIRGDTLGGSMRNIGGFLAQKKLTRAILSTLKVAGIPHYWQAVNTRDWQPNDDNPNIEVSLRKLYWQSRRKQRTLIYNLTVPLVKNNVDLCLFNASPDNLDETDSTSYIALGELKGGIDPAGADEHWKTARSALERIRKSFARVKQTPHAFFIGAAIEKKMATELWEDLQQGTLSNAANLNDDMQLASISRWLCNL